MKEWILQNNLTIKAKIWLTDHFVIFEDQHGKLWRYMPKYKMGWPVEVINGSHT